MKFILTSNSYMVTSSWSKEFGLEPPKMKLAFIDTAAEVYNKDEAEWLKADREALVKVGFSVEDYTLTDKSIDDLKNDLSKFDVFFVSGGNTFYLLEKAIKSGFVDLIKENYFSYKVYVGSSAGSVLLSNDIEIIRYLDSQDKAVLA
jgi:dipeptidase E